MYELLLHLYMILLDLLIILPLIDFFIGRAIGNLLSPKSKDSQNNDSNNLVIHNHIYENHLHVTDKELQSIASQN